LEGSVPFVTLSRFLVKEGVMTIATRIKTYLEENKIHFTLMTHVPTYASTVTAQVLHVPGIELAKTVIIRSGADTFAVVLPASYHIDFEKLAACIGKPFRLATEQEMAHVFPDCELGAMPPLVQLYGLRVYVDDSLAMDEEIVFNAGTHQDAIRMRFEDFKRLASPTICSFARKG
jgi:Ala-tRNA(Pro) deacylase